MGITGSSREGRAEAMSTIVNEDTLIHIPTWVGELESFRRWPEVEGAPDMVLEVVSRSSVQKDTVILPKAYWEAGVREYWLVDARKAPLRFDIFRHTAKGYASTRKQAGGGVKSALFGRVFRLTE